MTDRLDPDGEEESTGEAREVDESLPDAISGEVDDPSLARPEHWTMAEIVERVVVRGHSGPVPSSDWFHEVEPLYPGATKLILDDFLEERRHQREVQKAAIELDQRSFKAFNRYQLLQLAAAVAIVLIFASAGIVFIAMGRPVAGLILLAGELAVLAGVFVGRQALSRGEPPSTAEEDENES